MSNELYSFPDAHYAPRVLLVDDDPVFVAIASDHLAAAGFATTVATDGVEALETLDAEHFDLALIDLSMPRIDGLRLIGLIRGGHRHRRLGLVVVSGRTAPEAWAEAKALGANACEGKPVDWRTFPQRMRALLAEIWSADDANGVAG